MRKGQDQKENMIANNKQPEEEPEFKDVYVPAFCALMLHKLGGMQQITVELLEKFPESETPVIDYNPHKKTFVMMTQAYHKKKKRKRGIIKPSRKIFSGR